MELEIAKAQTYRSLRPAKPQTIVRQSSCALLVFASTSHAPVVHDVATLLVVGRTESYNELSVEHWQIGLRNRANDYGAPSTRAPIGFPHQRDTPGSPSQRRNQRKDDLKLLVAGGQLNRRGLSIRNYLHR